MRSRSATIWSARARKESATAGSNRRLSSGDRLKVSRAPCLPWLRCRLALVPQPQSKNDPSPEGNLPDWVRRLPLRDYQVVTRELLHSGRARFVIVSGDSYENMARAASPYPAPTKLGGVTYTETWLWHKSGRWQLHSLTEGQN